MTQDGELCSQDAILILVVTVKKKADLFSLGILTGELHRRLKAYSFIHLLLSIMLFFDPKGFRRL